MHRLKVNGHNSAFMLTFRTTDYSPKVFMATNGVPKETNSSSSSTNQRQRIVHWCSRRPFAPHIHAVHLETNTKAQNLPEYQVRQHSVHLDTGGHFLDFTEDTSSSDFQHCTSQQTTTASYTCENISPEGQTLILLSWNCKTSWQTPDHAPFSTHHLLQKWHCQRRRCTAVHIEGFGVVGASSYGSHTHPTFSRCFLRVKNKTHSTVTHHLHLTANKGCFWHASSGDTTTQFKQTSSLHSCQTVPSTDKQPSLNLSLGYVVFLSPCRSLQHKPPHLQIDMPDSSLVNSWWH